jgi:hypothetical protein
MPTYIKTSFKDNAEMDEKRFGGGGRGARRGCPFNLKTGLLRPFPFEHLSELFSKDANIYIKTYFKRQL